MAGDRRQGKGYQKAGKVIKEMVDCLKKQGGLFVLSSPGAV